MTDKYLAVPDWVTEGPDAIQDGDFLGEILNAFELVQSILEGPQSMRDSVKRQAEFNAWVEEQYALEDAEAARKAGLLN
jgi:hypothetical protein